MKYIYILKYITGELNVLGTLMPSSRKLEIDYFISEKDFVNEFMNKRNSNYCEDVEGYKSDVSYAITNNREPYYIG